MDGNKLEEVYRRYEKIDFLGEGQVKDLQNCCFVYSVNIYFDINFLLYILSYSFKFINWCSF